MVQKPKINQTVLLTGSVAYDRIMNFPGYFKNEIMPDKIHNLNVSFFVEKMETGFGGTAGNIAYNLALLGAHPVILARVGASDFAPYKQWLVKNNITTSHLMTVKNEHTASAYIITDRRDNQIAGFFPGAMLEPITRKKVSLPTTALAVVSAQHPIDMVTLPAIFKKKKIQYLFDPGQQVTSLSGAQLRLAITGCMVLIGNDYEISLISKKTGWSMKQLLGKAGMVVTTLADKGSVLRTGTTLHKIKAAHVKKVVDPTGAGDAYRAGLIVGLQRGLDLPTSGKLASVIAAYAVEQYGTQRHHFTWATVKKRFGQNFKQTL